MSPDLNLFAELQCARIRRELISATPRQTFAAQRRLVEVAAPTTPKIHRGGRPCKCADCCEARRVYVADLAARKATASSYRSYVTSLMEEC